MPCEHTIEQIETAIIDHLQSLSAVGVKIVQRYGGELDKKDLRSVTVQMPAVFVIWRGSDHEDFGQRKIEHADFVVILVQRATLKQEAGASVYGAIKEIRNLLIGFMPIASAFPMELQNEEYLYYESNIAVWGLTYRVKVPYLMQV